MPPKLIKFIFNFLQNKHFISVEVYSKKIFQFFFDPNLYLALLIIFLSTQHGYHFWPEYARVLGLRIDYLAPTVYLTDIFSFCLFCACIFSQSQQITKVVRSHAHYIVIFTLFALFNIFFSFQPLISLYHWLRIIQIIFIGWYVYKHKNFALKIVNKTIPYQVIFISLLAIAQYFNQGSIGGLFWWFGERTFSISTPGIAKTEMFSQLILRPYATFSHPNSLAGYLLITLVVIAFFLQQRMQSRREKAINVSSYILGVTTLAITFSRSAWVAGLAILVFHFILKQISIKTRHITYFVYLLVFFSIITPVMAVVFNFPSQSFPRSIYIRLQLFQAAWEMIQDHWLLGIGLGNFIPALPAYLPSLNIALLQPVHNIFWLIVSETGALGLIFVLLVLKKILATYDKSTILHTSLFILLAILITGTTDHYWVTLQQNRLLLAIVIPLFL